MIKPILQTPVSFDPAAHKGRVFVLPSLTVPEESYTVRELFERFSTGVSVDGEKVPIWSENPTHDDDDLEKLRDADPVVKEGRARRLADDIQRFESELKAQDAKAKASKEAAAKEAADKQADAVAERLRSKTRSNDELFKDGGAK